MASDLKLYNVVAFDAAGQAVMAPLNQWKVSYQARQASLEIKFDTYVKTYDLRTQVVMAGTGDSKKKVSIGKTLGRVALTGLLHGRHAATADLRWGGVDRDEYQEFVMVLDDTTRVTMEMDNAEVKELWELLPDAAKEDAASERAEKMMLRINAMVADGERVLTELQAKRSSLDAEFQAQHLKIEAAASFDERHEAREGCAAITQQLTELSTVQRAVQYDFAVIKRTEALKLANEAPPKLVVAATKPVSMAAVMANATAIPMPTSTPIAAPKPAQAASVSAAQPVQRPAQAAAAKPVPQKKPSMFGWFFKALAACLAAMFGLLISIFFGMGFGNWAFWVTLPFTFFGGGWLGIQMLAALMRR